MIDFSLELDRDLKENFNKAPVFKGTIQNELFECMLDVYHEEMTSKTKKAGKPVERFWNFFSSASLNSVAILKQIKKGDLTIDRLQIRIRQRFKREF